MQFNRDDNNFIRFLKDEKFIEWKLFPTDELNKYWEEFLLQFPDKRKDIKLAEKHFRHIKLSSYKQSPGKKQEAAKRLEKSLRRYYIKNNVRRLLLQQQPVLLFWFCHYSIYRKNCINQEIN